MLDQHRKPLDTLANDQLQDHVDESNRRRWRERYRCDVDMRDEALSV
jgi:hypothetical protein